MSAEVTDAERVTALFALLQEAKTLLWKLRRYEALEDGGSIDVEEAGIALAAEFDDWYARNPDPGVAGGAAPPAPRGGK